MNFKKHLEKAWKLTLQFITPVILMTLVMYVLSLVSFGILAPVMMAGYMQSILLMDREGREPKIQDIFSHMRLFFPLLGFGIVIFIAVLLGSMLFVIPGIIIAVGVTFSCLYMLPLMTDKDMGLIEAVKESYAMARQGAVADHIVAMIIFLFISAIGNSVFIGWLFTQPLATVFLLSVYAEKTSQISEKQHAVE